MFFTLSDIFNRLPLPRIPLFNDVSQARPGEMKRMYQRVLSYRPIQKLTPGGHNLFRRGFNVDIPVGLLQMDRVDDGV